MDLKVVPVESQFWGPGIGVAGLLTGSDFVSALRGKVHGDFVVLPSESMIGDDYLFLDDLNSHVSFWMIAGLWSLTYFITLIPISINGYGLQELSFTFLISHVAGVSPAVGLTFSVLMRAYQIIASLPGALFMPSALAAMTEKQRSEADALL
jgi:hypothetical protein